MRLFERLRSDDAEPDFDRVRFAALNAERAWIDPKRVANAGTAERLIAWTVAEKRAG